MLKKIDGGGYYSSNSCQIYGGLLLKNGRFAFLMERHVGDLRKYIDNKMQANRNRSPPSRQPKLSGAARVLKDLGGKEEGRILMSIAWAMWALHEHNIIHRDLKASNVLYGKRISRRGSREEFVVADFECSVGVVGTGYWRAPEILCAVQIGDIKSHLFTKESDVYSFSMTCFEVLTGCIPFEDLDGNDYNVVISGKSPKLPSHVDPMLKALLGRCWHPNPLERPSFKDILDQLKQIYPDFEYENVHS